MNKLEQKIDELKKTLGVVELEVMTKGYTLADAIRDGSKVTTQAYHWGDGETACALTAAVMAAKARNMF